MHTPPFRFKITIPSTMLYRTVQVDCVPRAYLVVPFLDKSRTFQNSCPRCQIEINPHPTPNLRAVSLHFNSLYTDILLVKCIWIDEYLQYFWNCKSQLDYRIPSQHNLKSLSRIITYDGSLVRVLVKLPRSTTPDVIYQLPGPRNSVWPTCISQACVLL